MGHRALDIELVARHRVSHPCTADDQALGAPRMVTTPSSLKSPKMAMSLAVSLTPSKARKAALKKRATLKWARARLRPRAMNRKCQRVKTSRSTHTPRTPPLVLVSSLLSMRTLTQSLTLGKKSGPHSKSSARTAPRRTAPRKTPVGHHPQRKSCQPMRCFKMKPGKKCSCLAHTLMLGITMKSPTMSRAGQREIP